MEFHIARSARERYRFDGSLFSFNGNVVLANIKACREFAHRMNQVREVEKHPELAVHPGQLYAMGLIDEASHIVMARYRETVDPKVMTEALRFVSQKVGRGELDRLLLTFVETFPGSSVLRGEEQPAEWLRGETGKMSHREAAFEEMLLLWMANRNPAFKPFAELFEEKALEQKTVYRQVMRRLPGYFGSRPKIDLGEGKGLGKQSLLEVLEAPLREAPESLSRQLSVIRRIWKPLLGEGLERYLEIADDILREEEIAIWLQFNPPARDAAEAAKGARRDHAWGPHGLEATAEVPPFGDPAHEYEKFSPDTAWMPTTVLMAKSTYVWLAQLSRKYRTEINRLDEIPDGELKLLADRGMNALWLIGIWERSRASKRIKQLCGNHEAVASAYSLFDYRIAEDLGGDEAYVDLRERARRYGVRLASDMVPNHMGIDSPWVTEHPEWFMSRADQPYPSYRFTGPDLSSDDRVEIQIEDHYFTQSDASVVFRRRDRNTGEVRYVYHGNDGTSFPWNDTAQLDYMNPAVREQVIQTILHVARLFPIIRFDAAMTLAKRHFHRLWFPGPGASGAIPSRAEYGMTDAEFNARIPQEFWREVVDRVATEVPGTLLLAEAFWLMEGYFVRTLGMHRVYNSAFMVMLRDEDNAKYRSVIKNTLEFDPDIMKRYVNFMSNPDERTAIDQFGKGDKCFGVAAMMATLPGLPMFGHGQIEGFTEKYGMEYRRPRYNEQPDLWLVERHEREIAPLLKRRWLFAESTNFLLYDYYTAAGMVDENVFAYSNRTGGERAVVLYNNRYESTSGTIDYSAAYADKQAGELRRRRLTEGLDLGPVRNPGQVVAWRDSITGLEYLRRLKDVVEQGLSFDLRAYECHVFLDWRVMDSTAERPWDRLADELKGAGVPSLDEALLNLELQPLHDTLRSIFDLGLVRMLTGLAEESGIPIARKQLEKQRQEFLDQSWTRVERLMRQVQQGVRAGLGGIDPELRKKAVAPSLFGPVFRERLRAAMRLPALEVLLPEPWSKMARETLPTAHPTVPSTALWGQLLALIVMEVVAESLGGEETERVILELFERFRLRAPLAQAILALGFEGEEAWRAAARVRVSAQAALLARQRAAAAKKMATEACTKLAGKAATEVKNEPVALQKAPSGPGAREALPGTLWEDGDYCWLAGVHESEGLSYVVREGYEGLLWWLKMPALLHLAGEAVPDRMEAAAIGLGVEEALTAAEAVGYQVEELRRALGELPAVVEPAASQAGVTVAQSGTGEKPKRKSTK